MFKLREDAEAFVLKPSTDKPEREEYYAVAKGAAMGIFTDWDSVSEATSGVKGAKYRKFETEAEALEFIQKCGD